MNTERNKTGICLGGGGALGFAHIGVIKALEEHDIYPDIVSGASMGAIIGVMYAEGYTADQIRQIVNDHKLYNFKNIVSRTETSSSAGLSGHKRIEEVLKKYIPHNSFEGLKRSFSLSVVDFRSAKCNIVLSGNNLIEYVLASMSIPLAFEPKIIEEAMLVDGGIMNNLPVEQLISVCENIIGIDVHTALPFDGKINKSNILPLTYRIMLKQMNLSRAEKCKFYITFPELAPFEPEDFKHFEEIYRIGYETTINYIKQHPDIMSLGKQP